LSPYSSDELRQINSRIDEKIRKVEKREPEEALHRTVGIARNAGIFLGDWQGGAPASLHFYAAWDVSEHEIPLQDKAAQRVSALFLEDCDRCDSAWLQ
jgi:hypothetical protein